METALSPLIRGPRRVARPVFMRTLQRLSGFLLADGAGQQEEGLAIASSCNPPAGFRGAWFVAACRWLLVLRVGISKWTQGRGMGSLLFVLLSLFVAVSRWSHTAPCLAAGKPYRVCQSPLDIPLLLPSPLLPLVFGLFSFAAASPSVYLCLPSSLFGLFVALSSRTLLSRGQRTDEANEQHQQEDQEDEQQQTIKQRRL